MYQHWGLCVIVELERGTANMTARSSFIHICSEIPATRFAQRSKSDYSEVIQIWFVEKRNPKIMLQNFQRTTLNTNNAETKLWSLPYYKKNIFFTSLLKVKFSTDKVRRALGSGGCLLIDWLIDCHHAQKPENGPISDLFNLTSKYFLPLLPYTYLVLPSTNPVPPSTNQYRPKLTQYHHISTITAPYWSSTTKYHQVSPPTDPVPSCIN